MGNGGPRQLDLAKRLRNEELAGLAPNLPGMAAWARADPDAGSHQRAAIEHAQRADSPWTLALVTAIAGRTAHEVGDPDAGAALLLDAPSSRWVIHRRRRRWPRRPGTAAYPVLRLQLQEAEPALRDAPVWQWTSMAAGG